MSITRTLQCQNHSFILLFTFLLACGSGVDRASATLTSPESHSARKASGSGNVVQLDVPGGSDTRAIGCNDRGDIVGGYVDADGVPQGFIRSANGVFVTISVPVAVTGTIPADVNNAGVVAGRYLDADFAQHGFILRDGAYETVEVPGALETAIRSIDDRGRITGNYVACKFNACTPEHPDPLEIGFIRDEHGFQTIFYPGTDSTDVWDATPEGELVGDWSTLAGDVFGYTYEDGVFTNTNPPGSTLTSIRGINGRGTLVGTFADADGNFHGFGRPSCGYVQIDIPGSQFTFTSRINARGDVVGWFADADGNLHGYLLPRWEQGQCREPGSPRGAEDNR